MTGREYWNAPACKIADDFENAPQSMIDALRMMVIAAFNAGKREGQREQE